MLPVLLEFICFFWFKSGPFRNFSDFYKKYNKNDIDYFLILLIMFNSSDCNYTSNRKSNLLSYTTRKHFRDLKLDEHMLFRLFKLMFRLLKLMFRLLKLMYSNVLNVQKYLKQKEIY